MNVESSHVSLFPVPVTKDNVNTVIVVPSRSRKNASFMKLENDLTLPSSIVVQSSLPIKQKGIFPKEPKITPTFEFKNSLDIPADYGYFKQEKPLVETFSSKDFICYSDPTDCILEAPLPSNISHEINDIDSVPTIDYESLQIYDNDEVSLEPPSISEFERTQQTFQSPIKEIVENFNKPKTTSEQMSLAMQDVIEGNMSIKRAAHIHGITYNKLLSSLKGHGSQSRSIIGADPALTEKEEYSLVDWIRTRYKAGFPVKKIDLVNRVADIVADGRTTRFKEGIPGEKWFLNFMSRHPSVSLLGPSLRAHSKGVPSRKSISQWFKNCEINLRAFGQEHLLQDKRRIGCLEEIVLCLNHSVTKVDTNEEGNCFFLPEESSGNISTLLGTTADGDLMPPMPIFSCRKPTADLVKSIPFGWGIGLSKNGEISKDVLLSYFKNVLLPWLSEQERLPFILFVDQLKTRLSVDIADFCAQKGLLIYNLYPNASYVIQPIYKSVISVIKKNWNILSHHKNDKQALLNFCPTLDKVISRLVTPETISQSFFDCGLYPFNPLAPDYSKCLLNVEKKEAKTFNSSDYVIALDIFENMIGKVKTDIFYESLQGLKLLRVEDAPLYKIWFKMVSKVDVTRNQSPEIPEYKHEKILNGPNRRIPRPDTYLKVDDVEPDSEDSPVFQKVNLFTFSDEINPLHGDNSVDIKEIGLSELISSNITCGAESSIFLTEDFPHCTFSEYWKNLYLGDCKYNKERIKTRREERNIKRQRRINEVSELNKSVKKKIKRALNPRMCCICWGDKGKLIVCKACRKFIHFDCMTSDEKQLLSDLYEDSVEFDYICLPCSS